MTCARTSPAAVRSGNNNLSWQRAGARPPPHQFHAGLLQRGRSRCPCSFNLYWAAAGQRHCGGRGGEWSERLLRAPLHPGARAQRTSSSSATAATFSFTQATKAAWFPWASSSQWAVRETPAEAKPWQTGAGAERHGRDGRGGGAGMRHAAGTQTRG